MNDKTKVLNSNNSKALYDLVVEWERIGTSSKRETF